MTHPTPPHEAELEEIVENMFMVGVQHAERTIPEIEKLQEEAKAAINAYCYKQVMETIGVFFDYCKPEKDNPYAGIYNTAVTDVLAGQRQAAAERFDVHE